MGQSILEEISVSDKHKAWIDAVSQMFGGLEHLHRLLELGGHGDGGQAGVGERPGALLQHADEVVDAELSVGVVQEPGELAVQILGR